MTPFLRVLNLLFLANYLLSIGLQYNDPDPMRWMLMYGAAAVACIIAMRRPVPRWLTGVTIAAALVWMAVLMPRVLGQVGLAEMFQERGMATMQIEEGREEIGLALIIVWMAVLLIWPRRVFAARNRDQEQVVGRTR